MTYLDLLLALAIGMPLGAFLLYAMIGLWNNTAAEHPRFGPVPVPKFWKALGVMFVVIVVRFFSLVAIIAVWTHFQPDAVHSPTADLLVGLGASFLALLAMIVALKRVLPTTFKQATGLSLLFALFVVVVQAIFFIAGNLKKIGWA